MGFEEDFQKFDGWGVVQPPNHQIFEFSRVVTVGDKIGPKMFLGIRLSVLVCSQLQKWCRTNQKSTAQTKYDGVPSFGGSSREAVFFS